MVNIVIHIIFIIVVFLLSYWIKKKQDNKVTVFNLLLALIILSAFNVFVAQPLEDAYKEWSSPKPDVEVFLSKVEIASGNSVDLAEDLILRYFIGCKEFEWAYVEVLKIKEVGKYRGKLFLNFGGPNKGCENCPYYEINAVNYGKGNADELEIEGWFNETSPIIEEIVPGSKTLEDVGDFGLNSFNLITSDLRDDGKYRGVARIFLTKPPENELIIETCKANGLSKFCKITKIESKIFQINRSETSNIKLTSPRGRELLIELPSYNENSLKFYVFDNEEFKFKENEGYYPYILNETLYKCGNKFA